MAASANANANSAVGRIHPLSWLAALPYTWLYRLADGLAVVGYWGYPKYRRLVLENLARAFPELDEVARRALAKRFYRNLADLALESIKALRMRPEEFRQRVQFDNMELLQTYADRGQSVLLLPTHQCNWEWLLLASSLALPMQLQVVYRPLAQSSSERLMRAARERFGAELIATDQTFFELRRNRTRARTRSCGVAIVADQTPKRKAKDVHWLRWFAHDTAWATGPEKIAKLLRYPVVFVHMHRIERGHYRVRFETLAEPPYPRAGWSITEAYAAATERLIRSAPSDWLWSYRRWRFPRPDAADVASSTDATE